jgi:hypothetical protein
MEWLIKNRIKIQVRTFFNGTKEGEMGSLRRCLGDIQNSSTFYTFSVEQKKSVQNLVIIYQNIYTRNCIATKFDWKQNVCEFSVDS